MPPRDLNPTPLSESEQFQLNRLLARTGENLAEARQRREKELALEAKLQAKRDKLAAEEARLAKRLAQLHVDLDVVSGEIFKLAPSGIAFRTVSGQLQQLAELAPKQSFFNSRFDTLDQTQIRLLAEIGLSLFEAGTRGKGGPSLREKMQNVRIDVGQDAPGEGGAAPDNRSALAAAIIAAGKKRRNEI
jgi:hypothetical protein